MSTNFVYGSGNPQSIPKQSTSNQQLSPEVLQFAEGLGIDLSNLPQPGGTTAKPPKSGVFVREYVSRNLPDDLSLIELNEAFASQSLAICRTLQLDETKVNVNGGAIALGHPLGCTGAKLTVQIMNELELVKGKYGMVTMCVGTGQGAAGIFELL